MAQPGNRAAWASSDDYTFLSLAVIIIGLGFGAWLLWQFQHPAISAIALQVGHSQIQVIRWFTDRYDLADAQMRAADPAYVTFPQLLGLFRDLGSFFRIPAALIVAVLGVWCFLRAAPTRFCRPLDLEALIREQARSFRSTAAHVRRRLGLASIRAGEPRPADSALNTSEWVERWATGKGGGFDAFKARQELGRQLGPLWRGPRRASPQVRALLAVLALHLAQRRDDARALLGDLAESLPARDKEARVGPEQPLTFPAAVIARADAVLAEHTIAAPALAIADRHGFTAPALMSLLTEARLRAGVLAPAQFTFLKLVDRRLWYALHSLGFPSDGPGSTTHPNPRIEAVGARGHWAAELAADRPLLVPALDHAVSAIRAAARDRQTQTSF